MKKPTTAQLHTQFERLKELNRPGFHKGSFSQIAEKFDCTPMSIKNLLTDRVSKWKPHHFQIWKHCVKFC